MIIGFCLFILGVLAFFAVFLGNSFMGNIQENTVSNDAIVNGSTTTFQIDGSDVIFNIDPITGATAMIIGFSAIAIIFGIQVVGSGLSSETVRVIVIAVMYTAVWGVLSVLAMGLFDLIQTYGLLIYVALTILYVVGVIQKISSG